MNMNHYFAREVVGMGNKIVVPQLDKNGAHGMAVFSDAGFSSLIIVPIMTYRVFGILGAAYKQKRKFKEEYSQLLTVIANLVGMALNKRSGAQAAVPQDTGTARSDVFGQDMPNKRDAEAVTAGSYDATRKNPLKIVARNVAAAAGSMPARTSGTGAHVDDTLPVPAACIAEMVKTRAPAPVGSAGYTPDDSPPPFPTVSRNAGSDSAPEYKKNRREAFLQHSHRMHTFRRLHKRV